MKGIVFTMDAIFALVIAVVGISVLLFFRFYTQTPYSLHYSNAQAIFTNLASVSVASVGNSSPITSSLVNQFKGANETWPMFLGGISENSSNLIGPLEPIFYSKFHTGNSIATGIVAGYGNIYFASNVILYAVNATTNRTSWTTDTVSLVTSTPALAHGMIFYANSTNLTAADAKTGNIIWTTNSISGLTLSTQIVVYNNQVVFGSTDNRIRAYYANNGTPYWANYIGANPVSIAIAGGNLVLKTSTNTVYVIVIGGGTATQLNSVAYAGGSTPTRLVGASNTTYLGTGDSANAIRMNGTTASGFPVSTGSAVTGVAKYGSYIIYQDTAGIAAFSPLGNSYWSATVPSYFGGSVTNATPVATSSMVYTLWKNGLAGQNLSTGTIEWFADMPGAVSYPYMTLAYGRLYVEVNGNVTAYGSCYAPTQATLLSAAATMYLNGQSGCGLALLNTAYPAYNYTLFAGTPSTNTVTTAKFDGSKGYVIARNSGDLNSSYMSVSFWINVSAYDASGVRLVNYGDNGGCISPTYCGWFFYLGNTGSLQFAVMNPNGTQSNADGPTLSLGEWYHVVGMDNGTYVSLYVNANTPVTVVRPGIVSPTSTNINLTIGAGRPGDSRYFTGNIANVQIYNSALSRQQVSALYRQGVQGVPTRGSGLVAWYPLAGDANDYANFNTGFVVGSTKFVTKTYTSPTFSNAYQISRASTLLPVLNYTSGASNTINVGVYSWS